MSSNSPPASSSATPFGPADSPTAGVGSRATATPRVSLVMPVYDEEELVEELVGRCAAVLDQTPGGPHEIVVVDDGSRDRTLEILRRLATEEPRLIVVALSRNFGHQVAMTAALEQSSGEVVVAMDGDLQDPPEMLPTFLEHWRQGYDVVYARRRARKESWYLRLAYFSFYRLIKAVSDIELPLDSGDFALLSRRVVQAIERAPEQNRYLRGLRTWVGFRQKGIDVERHARGAGETKYSALKLFRLASDGIFAFSLVPLRLVAFLGAFAVVVSTLYGVYALIAKLLGDDSPAGFTALVLTVVFLSGVQMIFLGVVGEYVGRIYQEVKRRPHYLVGERIGGQPGGPLPQEGSRPRDIAPPGPDRERPTADRETEPPGAT